MEIGRKLDLGALFSRPFFSFLFPLFRSLQTRAFFLVLGLQLCTVPHSTSPFSMSPVGPLHPPFDSRH